MSRPDQPHQPPDSPSPKAGGRTAAEGTPVAVDVSRDRRARSTWLVFIAGPTIWFSHFMLVYLVAEAGCTGDGPGLDVFDPPVPVVLTLVATLVAVVLCVAAAIWGRRWWRASERTLERVTDEDDGTDGEDRTGEAQATDGAGPPRAFDADARSGTLAFAGYVLSLFSLIAVLFTGAPALVLWSC